MSEVTPEWLERTAKEVLSPHEPLTCLDGTCGERGCTACVLLAAAKALRAEREKRERAYDEARGLAETIHKRRYLRSAPQWEPLDDLVGVLTQVDNMAAGLLADAEKAEAENRRQAQEIERLLETISQAFLEIDHEHDDPKLLGRLMDILGEGLNTNTEALSTTDTAQQVREDT